TSPVLRLSPWNGLRCTSPSRPSARIFRVTAGCSSKATSAAPTRLWPFGQNACVTMMTTSSSTLMPGGWEWRWAPVTVRCSSSTFLRDMDCSSERVSIGDQAIDFELQLGVTPYEVFVVIAECLDEAPLLRASTELLRERIDALHQVGRALERVLDLAGLTLLHSLDPARSIGRTIHEPEHLAALGLDRAQDHAPTQIGQLAPRRHDVELLAHAAVERRAAGHLGRELPAAIRDERRQIAQEIALAVDDHHPRLDRRRSEREVRVHLSAEREHHLERLVEHRLRLAPDLVALGGAVALGRERHDLG